MIDLELDGMPRLTAALLIGMLLGFTLIKAGITSKKTVNEALLLKNGSALNTFFTALIAGMLLFFIARNCGVAELHTHPAYLWSSVIGGILAGAGLMLTGMTPVTSLAALAKGRVQTLWVLAGMTLALPAADAVSGVLSDTLSRWDTMLDGAPEPVLFFAPENPVLYLAGTLLLLIVLVHFTAGSETK